MIRHGINGIVAAIMALGRAQRDHDDWPLIRADDR
jgi:hypothetical protein